MSEIAELFTTGQNQAVRLPAHYHFDCKQLYISQEPKTGNLILSQKPPSWETFFDLQENSEIPADFMAERDNSKIQQRDLF